MRDPGAFDSGRGTSIGSAFGPVLVGMPGSGKTTIGALVARAIGMKCIDTDREIAQQAGMSVAEIIAQLGEDRFREMERVVSAHALGVAGAVVATGGGIVLHEELHPMLSSRRTVWLHAQPEVLASRIEVSEHPLLRGGPMQQQLQRTLELREPLYRKVSSLRVETTDVDPESVAKLIVTWLDRLPE
jgi:shikimate kinase